MAEINDELSYVHSVRMLYAVGYFFNLHNYFSFIIVSACVAFIFHLIITKNYGFTHCWTTRFTE